MYALSRQKFNVPVLAMAGIRDGCMQAGLLQAMVEPSCFPKGIRVELLDNCGHFLQAEQPDAVLKELLQHLT
jgi:pimeloyl-ACP methyl ester carboxylesterase